MLWGKADNEEHDGLQRHRDLPPVEPFRAPADEPEQVGQGQTHDEGQNGAEIVQRGAPVALGQVDAEEQNVAGLGVGKDMVAAHIGVGVHKAAAERQHDAQLNGFAHLLGDAFHDWHYHAFF